MRTKTKPPLPRVRRRRRRTVTAWPAVAAVVALGLLAAVNVTAMPSAHASIITDRGPSVGVDRYDNQFVFWRGTGGQLEEAWWDDSTRTWNGPIDLHMGPLGSEPSVAIAPQQISSGYGWQYVYWEGSGSSHDLYMAYWGGGWHGPIDLGMGPLGSQPAASANLSTQQSLNVYWKGNDGNLWYAYADSNWTSRSGYSGPHAAYYNGHGFGVLGSSPSASGTSKSCLSGVCKFADVVAWQGTDGGLWSADYNPILNNWYDGPAENPCCGTLGGPPSLTAENQPPQQNVLDVVWQGAGGSYNLWGWSTGFAHSTDFGMGTLGSAPSIAYHSFGTIFDFRDYVFWKGSSDASLYEAYYDRSTEKWYGPIDLYMGPLG